MNTQLQGHIKVEHVPDLRFAALASAAVAPGRTQLM
jgi:hypothetical protein